MKELSIRTKLYRYIPLGNIFTYEVIEIRKNKDGVFYEVICESCTHGYRCKCLISINNENEIQYVDMLNDDDESQKYWHNGPELFHFTSEEAQLDFYKDRKESCEEQIKKTENSLKELRNNMANIIKKILELEGK